MGFVVNNSFGKFQAEADIPLPSFSAESLMSLPSKQFGAATVDADNVTNYEDAHWSKFTIDTSANTVNSDGLIYTRSDKGFHFTNDADSGKTLKIKLHNATKSLSEVFTLNPGDAIYRDGAYSTVVYVPEGGTEAVDGVVTVLPWMSGWKSTDESVEKKFSNDGTQGSTNRHGYYVEVLPSAEYVIPNGGNGGNGTGGNGGNGDNGGNGGNGGDDDTEEDETNYLLYGGIAALVVVGGIFASKMLKK